MKNNSSQSRFIKFTAKIVVILLAVVLSLSVLPALSFDIFPEASADVNYIVHPNDTLEEINERIAACPDGTVFNLTLTKTFDLAVVPKDSAGVITGIVIPKGKTVNLFFNGNYIAYDTATGGSKQLLRVTGIHNKGTLNLYSGENADSVAANGGINLANICQGLVAPGVNEITYCYLEGIRNEGTVVINGGVNININATEAYGEPDDGEKLSSQVATGATGVHNIGSAAECIVDAAIFNIYSYAYGMFTSRVGGGERTDSASSAYGIYGGNITINGNARFNVTADAGHLRTTASGTQSEGKAWITAFAFGIATDGDVNMNGGSISYDSNVTSNEAVKDEGDGRLHLLTGGILTSGGSLTMSDGTITTPSDGSVVTDEGAVVYMRATIAECASLPNSAEDAVSQLSYKHSNADFIKNLYGMTFNTGTFSDEMGNSYNAPAVVTERNGVPNSIIRGALPGTSRIRVVYRYWLTANRSEIDTSIKGKDGNVGYSYYPLTDGTGVASTTVEFNDGIGSETVVVNNGTKVSYISGGAPKNSNYWKLKDVAYAQMSSWFSDYNVVQPGTGSAFVNFETGITSEVSEINAPVMIFVDYVRVPTFSISAKVGTSNVVTTTYTGEAIKASDIGLEIVDSATGNSYTKDYDIDCTNSGELIPVKFSYTGTNTAGEPESGTGTLPTNAGTYQVNVQIDDQSAYNSDSKLYKNRFGLNHNFTLIIDQASANRGDLPEIISALTYGQQLNTRLDLSGYEAADIVKGEALKGSFSFTNSADGSSFKNAGTHTVSITWTPRYTAEDKVANYKETEFDVSFTVNKATLTITPNNAKVIYGNTDFEIPYSVTVDGLIENDNNEATKAEIEKTISYAFRKNNVSNIYNAGETVGVYNIELFVNSNAAVFNNYALDIRSDGFLTIEKRPLTVSATAVDRAYEADNDSVKVKIDITDGIYGEDVVSVNDATGTLNNKNVGINEVVIASDISSLLAGDKRSNYYVADVKYATGEKLLANISKVTPTVAIPTVEKMYYRNDMTLSEIELQVKSSSVEGEWKWVNEYINPTVNVSTYKAQFIPTDAVNYEIQTADIAIEVMPTPVVVTYEAIISYGDNIPNITAYTYKSEHDPSFDISKVKTAGNITPETTYTVGAGVAQYPVTLSSNGFTDLAGNYIFSIIPGTITVKPRTITFNVSDYSITYGEEFVPSNENIQITYDNSVFVGTDTFDSVIEGAYEFTYETNFTNYENYQVGSYYIKAYAGFYSGNPNYDIAVNEGVLKVTEAPLVIVTKDIKLEYGSELPDASSCFEAEGLKKGDTINSIDPDGKIKLDTEYVKGSIVNKNGYPITIDFSDVDIKNYKVTVKSATLTVVKATPEIEVLPSATLTYGQSLGDAVFIGGNIKNGVTGKFVYDNAALIPAYSTEPYGIYTATFIPDDTVNYNTVKKVVPLTVNATNIAGYLSVTGIPMVGKTLEVDTSNLVPSALSNYIVIWNIGNESVQANSLVLKPEYKGEQITVQVIANAPYVGTATSDPFIVAASDLASIENILNEAAIGDQSVQYNAQEQKVELNINTNGIGAVTVKYNGSAELPKAAGKYTVTIDIAATETYAPVLNYEIGTLTITKAPYNVEVNVLNKVYDGTTAATAEIKSASGAINGDKVAFDNAAAIYFFQSADAGENIAVSAQDTSLKLKGADAENYELILTFANNGKAVITKKSLEVKIIPVERDYEKGNTKIYLSFETDTNTLVDGDEGLVYVDEDLVEASIDEDNAGTRNVTVSNAVLKGDRSSNYELKFTNLEGLTVQIHKATPALSVPMVDTLYYDSTRPLSEISLGDSHWSWDPAVADEIPNAGEHTYKAIYTPDDQENFNKVEQDVTFEIAKATVTVKAQNYTVTYGNDEPTYTYTVLGVYDMDSFKASVDGYVIMTSVYRAGNVIGTYPITLTGTLQSDNYIFNYEDGVLTVEKRTAYVEAVAKDRPYEPGNRNVEVNFSELSNIYADDSLELSASTVLGTVDSDTAGIKNVTYPDPILVGDKADNYNLMLLNPTLKVEIQKASVGDIKFPTDVELEFGQKLGDVLFEDAENGRFSMENPEIIPDKVGTFTNSYKVVFTPFNVNNYKTETSYITVKINPAVLDMYVDIEGTLQSGNTLSVVLGNIPENAQQYIYFNWYRVDSPNAVPTTDTLVATGTDSYTLTNDDVGMFIICVAENIADSPYVGSAQGVTGDFVEEEKLTFWEKFVRWFYTLISNFTSLFGGLFG